MRFKVWIHAARPHTLPLSVSPVIAAAALAAKDGLFKWIPVLLALAAALFAQIAANYANDYFDYKAKADGKDRQGPLRVVSAGLVTPNAMRRATALTLFIAFLCGSALIYYGGFKLIFVCAAVVLGALAYSAGPFPLAYKGLGDAAVIVFFGPVPLLCTYYVQTLNLTLTAFLLSLSFGFLTTNILVVNNYRDYKEDKKNGKRTTVVIFGEKFAERFYLSNIALAVLSSLLALPSIPFALILALFFLFALRSYRKMTVSRGAELNSVLAESALNVLVFAALAALWITISGYLHAGAL